MRLLTSLADGICFAVTAGLLSGGVLAIQSLLRVESIARSIGRERHTYLLEALDRSREYFATRRTFRASATLLAVIHHADVPIHATRTREVLHECQWKPVKVGYFLYPWHWFRLPRLTRSIRKSSISGLALLLFGETLCSFPLPTRV